MLGVALSLGARVHRMLELGAMLLVTLLDTGRDRLEVLASRDRKAGVVEEVLDRLIFGVRLVR